MNLFSCPVLMRSPSFQLYYFLARCSLFFHIHSCYPLLSFVEFSDRIRSFHPFQVCFIFLPIFVLPSFTWNRIFRERKIHLFVIENTNYRISIIIIQHQFKPPIFDVHAFKMRIPIMRWITECCAYLDTYEVMHR